MTSPSVYLRLLQLRYSNRYLLQLYYNLYSLEIQKENWLTKKLLSKIINIREVIKTELEEFLKDIQNQKKQELLTKIGFYCIPNYFELKYYLKKHLEFLHEESFQNGELNNVDLYYAALYTPSLGQQRTDVLLLQKGKIEDYLMKYM